MGEPKKSISLRFPLDPVPKDRHRSVVIRGRRGPSVRSYSTRRNEVFERDVKRLARFQMPRPLVGPLRVFIIFTLPVPKPGRPGCRLALPAVAPDIDNLIKSLFDGLNRVAWKDDAQVVQVHAQKVYAEKGKRGEIFVIIEPIKDSLVAISGIEPVSEMGFKGNRRKTDKKKGD